MRVFRTHERPSIDFALIYGVLAILMLAAARLLPVIELAPDCVFQTLTGLPCPTCGSTRSITFLSRGDFLSALTMNPLTAAVFGAAVFALVCRTVVLLFGLPGFRIDLSEGEKNWGRLLGVVLFFLNWLYLMFMLPPRSSVIFSLN